MPTLPPIVRPDQWGARVDYDSKHWTPWNPDKWVIHYGGGPVSGHNDGAAREMAVLRAWEWYHLGKGWRGIAYNYAIGQSGMLYRLRGENSSGATSGDADRDGIPENHEARAVVFILGGSQEPSQAALSTFAQFWAADPMPVIGHRDSSSTPCPGVHLYRWIQDKGYEEMVDHNTQLPTISALQPAYAQLVKEGVFSESTRPGHLVDAQKLAAFLIRERNKVTKKLIATAVAGVTGGATVSQVIEEIVRRLG